MAAEVDATGRPETSWFHTFEDGKM